MIEVSSEYEPFLSGQPAEAAPKPETPGLLSTVRSAGAIANWPYRSYRYLKARSEVEYDPTHNPFEMIKGTKYESDPERFAFSRDERETRAIMAEWDEDEEAMHVLARSGGTGTVAAVGMGLLDPTIFLPVFKVFSGTAQGVRAARLAADVGLAAGAGAAIGEGAMAATTPHYGFDDAAIGIGSATLLGGFVGGAAGALLSRSERRAMVKALDSDRAAWEAEAAAGYKPPKPQAAGAAATDTRALTLRGVPLLSKLPDPTAKMSPSRRVLNSPFEAARRTVADLVETPYIFEDNVAGVATTQGPALDRTAKLEIGKARVGLARKIDGAYSRYRFGGEAETWRQSLAQKGTRLMDYTGRAREKASSAEFIGMVDDALRNGDAHPVPEVAEVAKWMRSNVLDPWRDRAIAAGLLPEGVEAATADSYMTRVWNKQRLVGERPRAVQVFSDWLEGEEAKKATLQNQLRDLSGRLAEVNAKISTLEKATVKKLGHESELIDLGTARDRLRGEIEKGLAQWDGKSTKAVKAAMKARDEQGPRADGERRVGADDAVDQAVKRVLAKERLRDRKEVQSLANEIIDRITGTPDGRLPYDAHTAPRENGPGRPEARGALAARDFMIPDALVRDFIDTDARNTAEIYLNTMVPDVLLTERFGDVRMTQAQRKIAEEAAAMEEKATTPAERARIHAWRDAVIADVAAMRDRIRHTYGISSDPRHRFIGRMALLATRYDVLTNLGGAALSSMADIAGLQWRHGFGSAFRNAWRPMFKMLTNPEVRAGVLKYRKQLQTLGIAAETYLATRTSGLHDVTDAYRATSRFERGVQVAADKFQKMSLLAQWTDFGKLAAGMVSGSELIRASKAVAVGKGTAKQIRDLAESGIDNVMAQRIAKELEREGALDVVDGIELPNTGNWRDDGAREAFEGALARDVDIMIITPGAEKPLMMSNPIAALILQYKSFVAAATERLLVRSMQQRDINVLHGLVSAIGLGVLAEYAYSGIVGRDPPKTAGDLIKAGVTRSGVLGWYQEGNALSEKWFGLDGFAAIGAQRPDSRYISRETLTAALGPTAGKIEALIKTGRNVASLDWTAADTRRMRRMLVGQNLFYIRSLLDRLEAVGNEAVGVEPLKAQ